MISSLNARAGVASSRVCLPKAAPRPGLVRAVPRLSVVLRSAARDPGEAYTKPSSAGGGTGGYSGSTGGTGGGGGKGGSGSGKGGEGFWGKPRNWVLLVALVAVGVPTANYLKNKKGDGKLRAELSKGGKKSKEDLKASGKSAGSKAKAAGHDAKEGLGKAGEDIKDSAQEGASIVKGKVEDAAASTKSAIGSAAHEVKLSFDNASGKLKSGAHDNKDSAKKKGKRWWGKAKEESKSSEAKAKKEGKSVLGKLGNFAESTKEKVVGSSNKARDWTGDKLRVTGDKVDTRTTDDDGKRAALVYSATGVAVGAAVIAAAVVWGKANPDQVDKVKGHFKKGSKKVQGKAKEAKSSLDSRTQGTSGPPGGAASGPRP